MAIDSALWRRLDTPGHDAGRVEEHAGGAQLEGAAVFRHEGLPASLTYRLACDRTWRTREGEVRGWLALDAWSWPSGERRPAPGH